MTLFKLIILIKLMLIKTLSKLVAFSLTRIIKLKPKDVSMKVFSYREPCKTYLVQGVFRVIMINFFHINHSFKINNTYKSI